MEYVKSRYNILVQYHNNETIIFNPLSGAIGKFDSEALQRYETNTCSEKETQLLVRKGIYIPSNYDEIEKINYDRTQSMLDERCKYIRIWTTSACNARCYYCYEQGIKTDTMTQATADATVTFISKMLKAGDELNLEWFGGEPLLNQNIIDYIMNRVDALCKERNCKLSIRMITNGSLIDEYIADKLAYWQLSSIQITLDGYGEVYDKIKNYYQAKKYNFQKVIKSIKLLNDRGIKIGVRMNYDMQNYSSLTKLIDYLHCEFKDRKNIFYYVYPVWSGLNENKKDSFVSTATTDENYIRLLKLLVENKMCSVREIARLNYRKGQCKSCLVNGYSIFPSGKIGKCSETFLQVIGDVWNGVVDTEMQNFWISPDLDVECKDCICLPLCQGGCKSSNFTKMQKCYVHKDILPDILRWYVETLEQNN